MAITARSENFYSDIVDLGQVMIRFASEKDRSASALVIGRVQAITRRWCGCLGKHLEKNVGSYQSVNCQSAFHLRNSFPRDLRNGMSFSQYSMPSTSSFSCSSLFTIIYGTRQVDGGRVGLRQKIDLALRRLRSQ